MVFKPKHRIFLIILGVILFLLVGSVLLIQSPKVQTYLIHKISSNISEKINSEVYIARIRIDFFSELVLEDFSIRNPEGTEILKLNELKATVDKIHFSDKKLVLDKISLNQAEILLSFENEVSNFQYILDSLSKPDKNDDESFAWDISCSSLELKDGHLSLRNLTPNSPASRFDDLDIRNVNFLVSDLYFPGDTIKFNVERFNGLENQLLNLYNLAAECHIDPNQINIRDLNVQADKSNIDMDYLQLTYRKMSDFKDFNRRVNIKAMFRPSTIVDFGDIRKFSESIPEIDESVQIDGALEGRINSFIGNDFRIQLGSHTDLLADLNLVGLPDIKQTYFDVEIKHFNTSGKDVNKYLNLAKLQTEDIGVKSLSDSSYVSMYGRYSGFYDSFDFSGAVQSFAGNLLCNVGVSQDTDTRIIDFSGDIHTMNFMPEKVFNINAGLGKVNLDISVNGIKLPGEYPIAQMEGKLKSLDFKDYSYENIEINGELAERKYDGSVVLDDPNVFVNFNGEFDFSMEEPAFNFDMGVKHANLHEINLITKDSLASVSFDIVADFKGSRPETLDGRLDIKNTIIVSQNGLIDMDSLVIRAGEDISGRKILLHSDFVDGRLTGSYHSKALMPAVNNFLYQLFPAYFKPDYTYNDKDINEFAFNLQFKDTRELCEVLLPEFRIRSNTVISGDYNSGSQSLYVEGRSPQFIYNKKNFEDVNFKVYKSEKGGNYAVQANIGSFNLNENVKFKDFFTDVNLGRDSVDCNISWDNQDSVRNEGNIHILTYLERMGENNSPGLSVELSESQMFFNDTAWLIDPSEIRYGEKMLSIENFRISHNNQYFTIDGKASASEKDTLFLGFDRFLLGQLNRIANLKGFKFDGVLSGKAKLFSIFDQAMFYSDLNVVDFVLNQEKLGDLALLSNWDPYKKKVQIHAHAKRGALKTLDLKGDYFPQTNFMDFDLDLNKLRANIFNPFLESFCSDSRGIATGKINISGDRRKPILEGRVLLQKASLIVDYLNVRYYFTDYLNFESDRIYFENIEARDKYGNIARASGEIRHKYFKDLELNLRFLPENVLCLDTQEEDNDQFFGKAFGTGVVAITGPANNIAINISARSGAGTSFNIPLTSTRSVKDNNFLSFINDDAEEEEDLLFEQYEKGLDNEKRMGGLELNFDLEVTPEAEARLIFDSSVGGVIRGMGSGNLNLSINNLGKFSMIGDFVIEDGDYQFTVQNLPLKKFDVEPGGTISWTGDPNNALIDIEAVYRLKASLYDLILDDTNDDYTTRIPIECHLLMTEDLSNPDIDFEIILPPTTDDLVRGQIANLSDAEMNIQIISLLVINRFTPLSGYGGYNRVSAYENAGLSTTTDLLSSQLNYWLSQISNDFDIGFNYRPGDEITNNQMEVAFSTQLLDDRVRINVNGNMDVSRENSNTNNIVGDVDVEYKIKKNGKLRLKAFNRANNDLIYDYAPYTQGMGLFYREEFDTFGELLKEYWRKIFSKSNEAKDENSAIE